MNKKTESAVSFVGKWAETGKDEGMEEHHSDSVNFMLNQIFNQASTKFNFIDAGCGNGWVVRKVKLHPLCKNASGIDGAAQMINKAKSLDPAGSYFHNDLIQWNPDCKYDFVHSMEVFYYFEDPQVLLKKIYKDWLSEKGKLIFGIDHYLENKSSLDWPQKCGVFMNTLPINKWHDLILEAGFKNIRNWQIQKKKDWLGTLVFYAEK